MLNFDCLLYPWKIGKQPKNPPLLEKAQKNIFLSWNYLHLVTKLFESMVFNSDRLENFTESQSKPCMENSNLQT